MDQIKFVIEEPSTLEGVDFKRYDVAVYLNDKKLAHNLFNAAEVLPVYKYHFAEFDMFTCSCGIAGCAGFQAPVIHTAKEGIVTWTFPEGDSYKTDKKVYQFVQSEFQEVFAKLNKDMLALEKKKMFHDTLIRDESMYIGYDETLDEKQPRFEAREQLKESLKWFENRYQGVQNFNDMLEEKYPDLVSKDFRYTYEKEESKYAYSLGDVVGRLLNQFPSRAKEKSYLKSCEVAVEAIIDMLNGNNKKFKKIAHNSYEKYEMSSHHLISWDMSVKEEDFDFEKLGLIVKN